MNPGAKFFSRASTSFISGVDLQGLSPLADSLELGSYDDHISLQEWNLSHAVNVTHL